MVKPVWISLKQETVSGSGISWAICKSAPRSRQIATQVFPGRMPFLPSNQQRESTEGTDTEGKELDGNEIWSPPHPNLAFHPFWVDK